MLADYGFVLLFLINGAVFAGITLLVAWLLRPNRPSAGKLSTYECGEDPVGSAWIQFNHRFYVIALMFLIFEVEVVLLFPWATVFKSMGWYAFWAMLVFVSLIFVGFLYELGKGDLQWDKPRPVVPQYVEGVGVVVDTTRGEFGDAVTSSDNGAPLEAGNLDDRTPKVGS